MSPATPGPRDTSCYPGSHESISIVRLSYEQCAAQDISFVFVFPASGPRGQVLPAPGQAIWCCNSFDKTHLKCNKFYVSNKIFLYCQAYGLVLSSIRNFLKAWVGRCSNKRVLFYALCTFVDIIVNSSNLCESWEDRRNVSLSGYYGVIEPEMLRCCRWCNALRPFGLLSLSLSHSNVTSRSGSKDQHKVYREKWLLEIENDIFLSGILEFQRYYLQPHWLFIPPSARIIISRIRPALYLLGVLSVEEGTTRLRSYGYGENCVGYWLKTVSGPSSDTRWAGDWTQG